MSSKRPPFWLSATDFDELDRLIMTRLDAGDQGLVRAIHEELAVARTRFTNGRFRGTVLTTVLGLDKDSIPVRLAAEEHAYLLTLTLSDSLRGGLATT